MLRCPLRVPLGSSAAAGGGSGEYQLVVTFAGTVTFSGANLISGTGSVGTATASGSQITANLTGISDAQKLTVRFQGVSDGTASNDVMVSMIVLIADTTANLAVTVKR